MKEKEDPIAYNDYNVFLSWSGPRSQALALFFHKWLPRVIQVAKPFYSTAEISKGSASYEEIREALNNSSFGIAFITRENSQAPWIQSEIGALWGDRKRFSPFMIDEDIGEIKGLIPTVQQTKPDRDDVLRLIHSIRDILIPDLSDEVVDRAFEREWSDLEQKIKEVQNTTIKEEKQWYGSFDPVLEGVDALKALPQYMRMACISEACGYVSMPDGSCPYAGKEDHVKYAGVEYTYRRLKRGALLKVGKHETLSAPKLLEHRNQNEEIHENWVRAQFYLQTYKTEILEYFKEELKDLKG